MKRSRGDQDFDGEENLRLVSRIIERRIQECRSLRNDVIQNHIVNDIPGPTAGRPNNPLGQFEYLVKHHYNVASSPREPCQQRRESWDLFRALLSRVDDQVGRNGGGVATTQATVVAQQTTTASSAAAATTATSTTNRSGINTAAIRSPAAATTSTTSSRSGTTTEIRNSTTTTITAGAAAAAAAAATSASNDTGARSSRLSSRNDQLPENYRTNTNPVAASDANDVDERAFTSTSSSRPSSLSQLPVHPAMINHNSTQQQQNNRTRNGVSNAEPPPYQRHSSVTLQQEAEKAARLAKAPLHPALANNNNNNNRIGQNRHRSAPTHPSMQQHTTTTTATTTTTTQQEQQRRNGHNQQPRPTHPSMQQHAQQQQSRRESQNQRPVPTHPIMQQHTNQQPVQQHESQNRRSFPSHPIMQQHAQQHKHLRESQQRPAPTHPGMQQHTNRQHHQAQYPYQQQQSQPQNHQQQYPQAQQNEAIDPLQFLPVNDVCNQQNRTTSSIQHHSQPMVQMNGNSQPSRMQNPIVTSRRGTSQQPSGVSSSGTTSQDQDASTATVSRNCVEDDFEPPKVESATTDVEFPREEKEQGLQNTRYSSSYKGRPAVLVRFRKQKPGETLGFIVGQRLGRWEPFWHPVKLFSLGATSPIDDITIAEPTRVRPNVPLKTAAVAKIMSFPLNLVNYWGNEGSSPPQPGERRLLLRMIPMIRDEATKKKRADCHQWPKGTYLMINGQAAALKQRKQQSHDEKEWKMLSHPLDMAQYIRRPEKPCNVAMACHDSQQFLFCIALCEYISPESLIKKILAPGSQFLDRPSLAQIERKAVELAKQSVATLIDDSDDEHHDSSQEQGRFVFSVYCPVTKKLLEKPVRGKQCKHFQCFDLEHYIRCNSIVSGGRWRCGSETCDQFVSYQDLQYCSFTEKVIEKYRHELSDLRNRVEVYADGKYQLLPEQQRRYKRRTKQPSTTTNNGGNGSSNVKNNIGSGGNNRAPVQRQVAEPEEIVIDSD